MDNRNDSMIVFYVWLAIIGFCIMTELGFIGILIGYFIMTKYTYNFVLMPLSKKISAMNITPQNYVLGKLKTTRMIIWIISAMLNFPIMFFIELIAIAISMSKSNEIRTELGLPKVSFSKDAYLIYEEYWKFSEDTEPEEYENEEYKNEQIEDFFENKVIHKKIKTVIKKENLENKEEKLKQEIEEIKNELYKTISEEPILYKSVEFDFNKPVDEIGNVEPIKTSVSSIWDNPIESTSNVSSDNAEAKKEVATDEICCEKCGTIMSKMKIACPKCGTLVKTNYRTGK